MNTTETLNATEGTQPVHHLVQPIKFPNQPQEWKIISLRECPTPEEMQLCDEPERAAAYWRTHVTADPRFNPDCECFVVLMLNTRRRIRGHYLVSIGTMDTILVHPREVFRLAVMANAHALVLVHNLCVAAHKLCYVARRFMWSDASVVPMSTQPQRRKDGYWVTATGA